MSSYVVYGAPPAPEPPSSPLWEGLTHTWTGWDGTTFDLTAGTAGVYLLLDGVTGMHLPEFDQYLDEYAGVDGGRYRGDRTRVRQPSWTIGIFGDNSRLWRARDTAFWKTIHTRRPGMWTVTDPDGRSRSLLCRLRSSGEHEYSSDPMYAGLALYPVELLAEQPYWTGAPVQSPVWRQPAGVPFTGPTDAAPAYHLARAATSASATLKNEGDVDADLVHVVKGPVESVVIGAAGGTVAFGQVNDGSVLRINTDPTYPIATLDGTDVTEHVVPWDPAPIPAGETTQLDITLVGAGSLQSSFIPRYWRAL